MGSAVGTATGHQSPTSLEMNAYLAVKKAYEALPLKEKQEEAKLLDLADLYDKVSGGRPNARRRRSTSAGKSEVARFLEMSEDDKVEMAKAVLQAAMQKEIETARAAVGTGGDYANSFSGTKNDTQISDTTMCAVVNPPSIVSILARNAFFLATPDSQVENEFASLVRGDQGTASKETLVPLLRPIECNNQEELAQLRSAGKWLRYLGAKGCYMWIHALTKEVTALRPPDYVDEQVVDEKVVQDGIAGYPSCLLSELPDLLRSIVDDDKMTPLLIDNSDDDKVTAFLSYKAVLVDVSVLAMGYQKSGIKVSDLMETVRTKSVAAMKSGSMLALRLGHLTSEHANFKRKLCVRNMFAAEMFQEGGKKMFTPVNKPRCNLMFREEDMEQGQCLVKSDNFRFCAVTSLPPKEVVDKLGETIPLGYMQPVYVST